MAETVKMRIKHLSFIAFQVSESQFRQPVADKVSPVIEVGAACAGNNANPTRNSDDAISEMQRALDLKACHRHSLGVPA